MSNRFHSKWHRTSHQTYKHPDILDAGWDPIASHDVPFSGDFVMAPSVSGWCVSAEKNSLGDIYSWSPNNVITIDAHHDPSAEPPDPDNSTINLVAGIINFDINETNINGHLNVKDWVEISGMSGDGDTGYGLIVHESAVVSGDTSAIGDITTDGNLYVTGSEPSAGSAYFKAISATEATIVSALINEVDISASESNGYIMKTPNPQGTEIPNPMSISAGVNNFYLSGDTLYSDSWGYFVGELKTASALYADGPVMFDDTLNVAGKATFDNEISAAFSITTKENLYVSGNETVSGFGKFGTYVSAASSDDDGYGLIVEKKANIKGNTEIGGTLGVTGQTTMTTFLATENGTIQGIGTIGTLEVTGDATFNGDVTIASGDTTITTLYAPTIYAGTIDTSGDVTIDGDVNVISGGGLYVNGEVIFDDDLHVSGDTTLKNTSVSGTLGVTGATTLNSTLNVSGNTTTKNLAVSGTLGVTGATTLGSTLGVTGATTLNSTLNVSGNTTTKNLAVSGTLNVRNPTTLNRTLEVNDITTIKNAYLSILRSAQGHWEDPSARCLITTDGASFYVDSPIPGSTDNYSSYNVGNIQVRGRSNPDTGTIQQRTFTFPITGGTLATETYVTNYVSQVVGDINTILDTINGEVI